MSDADIYRSQNFGNRIGFGRRSALLVVDFTVGFNDPALFGGGNIDAAVKRTAGLEFFRSARLPVAFTRIVYAEDGSDAGVFCLKAPNLRLLTETHPAGQIVAELAPMKNEYIIRKTQTVVVAGCTTSGCVRASVVDALSHNFRPIVARDCVGDRALGPHQANLFDMAQKYADVLERDAILDELQ